MQATLFVAQTLINFTIAYYYNSLKDTCLWWRARARMRTRVSNIRLLLLLLCISIVSINVVAHQEHFQTMYQWSYFDYKWKNTNHKAAAIASGDYNYTKCVIIDVDHSKGERSI